MTTHSSALAGTAAGAAATAANQALELTALALLNADLVTIASRLPGTSSAGAATSVGNAASDTLLLAANANRIGATIFNDDTATTGATLNVILSTTAASATVFTVRIPAQGYYEVPFGYRGQIRGFASAATGNARITELT